jgi:hypothetical protein
VGDNDLPGFRSVEEARDALLRVIRGGDTTNRTIVSGEPCTPSTEHVRAVYAAQHGAILAEEHGREFDRWLAQHDAERDRLRGELAWITEHATQRANAYAKARGVIENAPHAYLECTARGLACTCWKANALG